MEELAARVAANVRVLREARAMTLAELSARSNVARSTLAQVEAGAGNPTLSTLGSLARALGATVDDLLAEDSSDTGLRVVRAGGGVDMSDGALTGHLAASSGVERAVLEFYSFTIAPGRTEASASHGTGAREHVLVTAGAVRVGPVDATEVLGAGDYASYPADGVHRWACASEEAAVFWVVVSLPRA